MDYDTPLFRVTNDILSDDTSVNILTMMKVDWLHDKCSINMEMERKDDGKSEVSRYDKHNIIIICTNKNKVSHLQILT